MSSENKALTLYADGASRGNPGAAAIGVIAIVSSTGAEG
jgi:ribonuclease HI